MRHVLPGLALLGTVLGMWALAAGVAKGEATATAGACAPHWNQRWLTVTLTVPSTAKVGEAVEVDVLAETPGTFFDRVVDADLELTADGASVTKEMSGLDKSDAAFTLTFSKTGEFQVVAMVTDRNNGPCSIPAITVDATVAVTERVDTSPPQVSGLRSIKASAGGTVAFRFSITGEASVSRAVIAVYVRRSRRRVALITTPWRNNQGSVEVKWKPTQRLLPGRYDWCVSAADAKRNISRTRCASLLVK